MSPIDVLIFITLLFWIFVIYAAARSWRGAGQRWRDALNAWRGALKAWKK